MPSARKLTYEGKLTKLPEGFYVLYVAKEQDFIHYAVLRGRRANGDYFMHRYQKPVHEAELFETAVKASREETESVFAGGVIVSA
ncbi:MAG: hypothetical protein HY513_02365 [Candidatus Aenigmarchaeota archaeon]|nr:hypothetical protein [Candidatus Aenigmarchaeota archaeon]